MVTTILAFDELVADTRAARALAVAEAVMAECGSCLPAHAEPLLAGRSLDEAVEAAIAQASRTTGLPFDDTQRDLAVLRARRSFSGMVLQGLPLREGAAEWIQRRTVTHGRVVLRADSARRDVEHLLQLSRLHDVLTFIRCADDLPRDLRMPSIESSWRAIVARLAALQVDARDCVAFESHTACAHAAGLFVPTVQHATELNG